jgi:DNA ligase-associated metallophosphoesterase
MAGLLRMHFFQDHPFLTLLPEGAVFLAESSTLIVADVHLGKSATFRARGLPVPEGDTARDLGRLTQLVRKHQAARLVVAGDLFHAPAGVTPELESALRDFLAELEIPVTLVVGNHDARLGQFPAGLQRVTECCLEGAWQVIHDPAEATGDLLHLAGHWHPVVKIPDGKRASLRLPCFLFRRNTLILPSFGSFTGGAVVAREPKDRVFVALREKVVELPESLDF